MQKSNKFYFIRHGETEANAQGLMCGRGWDVPISQVGRRQARAAAGVLAHSASNIKAVYVSPMIRAQQTLDEIAKKYEDLKITVVDELAEWDIGEWCRKPFEAVKDQFLGDADPIGGESRADFKNRVATALDICLASQEEKLIVAHGAVWVKIQKILNLPPALPGNCIPFLVEKQSNWTVKRLSE